MKIAVVYILPHIAFYKYRTLAARFAESYRRFVAGCYHDLYVIVNGSRPLPVHQEIFQGIQAAFLHHTNEGKDIGAYQMFAEQQGPGYDLMVCLGAPVHFRREGWLDRMVEAYSQNGPGLYGAFAFHVPTSHVRTTSFWLPPQLLSIYPWQIGDLNRYEFEHGVNSITSFIKRQDLPVLQVTWSQCIPEKKWIDLYWNSIANADALLLDQHTDRLGFT